MRTILKWLTSGLQVVQKLLASGLLASKPMQSLQTLVFRNLSNINCLEMP